MNFKQGPVDPATLTVQPCLLDETVVDAAERLRAEGFKIADSDDLVEFATKRPEEMKNGFGLWPFGCTRSGQPETVGTLQRMRACILKMGRSSIPYTDPQSTHNTEFWFTSRSKKLRPLGLSTLRCRLSGPRFLQPSPRHSPQKGGCPRWGFCDFKLTFTLIFSKLNRYENNI